jgi:hypothetical protein
VKEKKGLVVKELSPYAEFIAVVGIFVAAVIAVVSAAAVIAVVSAAAVIAVISVGAAVIVTGNRSFTSVL